MSYLPIAEVSILLGKGDGTFEGPVNYIVGDQPLWVATADFNHDGKLDLVVANSLSNSVSVLLGNGDGTFGPAASFATPDFPAFVGVGDFNGDHNLDLVTIDESGVCPCISVLLGNGDGSFQEPPINTMPPDPAAAIGIGDFNQDGKLDLVTAGQFGSASEVGVLLGNGMEPSPPA